jgi:hypothetical protein
MVMPGALSCVISAIVFGFYAMWLSINERRSSCPPLIVSRLSRQPNAIDFRPLNELAWQFCQSIAPSDAHKMWVRLFGSFFQIANLLALMEYYIGMEGLRYYS